MTANLSLVAEPGYPLRIAVFGAALRDAESATVLLEGLAVRVGVRPEIRHQVLTWRDLKRSLAGPESFGAALTVSRSEFFSSPMPASAVVPLIDEFTSRAAPGRGELNFTAMGGAYNRVPADATAFVHRSDRFLLDHVACDGDRWLDLSWALAHGFASGRVYPNFPILVSTTGRPPTTAETPSASGRSSAATIPGGPSASRRRSDRGKV